MARDRTIFVTNIFLKLGNLYLASDHGYFQRRSECTLIFQSLSNEDQKMKSRNNPISWTLKKNIFSKNINEIYMGLYGWVTNDGWVTEIIEI